MSKNVTIVAGPCAVEGEEQIMNIAYKISLVRDIARPYRIDMMIRGGAWKPRTSYIPRNSEQKRIFEGVGEIGLIWLAEAAEKYDLPIVSELMSEMDLRYFQKHLEPERDYIQIGARTSKSYALQFIAGNSPFGIVLKNPEHGIDIKEALGSISRFEKNREIVYCTRGQMKFIHPNLAPSPEHEAYIAQLLDEQDQHLSARNLNNISAIKMLRVHLNSNILLCHDPSHTWGGKTHEMRRKIGEYAIKAITEYKYDWIMVEVNDESRDAKCDKEQALLTTLNGVDWSKTYVGKEPSRGNSPITLVDIVEEIMKHQVEINNESGERLDIDLNRLHSISFSV